MFGDFMGGGGRGPGGGGGPGRGSDLRYNMEVTLEDAFSGQKTDIRVPTSVVCDSCTGTGGEGGAAPVSCGTCGGLDVFARNQVSLPSSVVAQPAKAPAKQSPTHAAPVVVRGARKKIKRCR